MNEYIFFLIISAISILFSLSSVYFFAFKKIKNDGASFDNNGKMEKGWLSVQLKAENAVVQIFAVSSTFNWMQPFKTPIQVTVSGTGFFINDQGYFITNSHVVDQASSVWIHIPSLGKRNIDADIISICPDRDLALLRLRPEGIQEIKTLLGSIPYLQLGDSDQVHMTDSVLALGYPLGQHYLKATTGIVSGREHIEDKFFIQIDAAINPGSSGGPVLSANGKVVGISTVMVADAQSVGYIIPINELKIIIEQLHEVPFLRKQSLGMSVQGSTMELVKYLNNPEPGGLYVNKIYKNSIAERAGIQVGDMIYEFNGAPLDIYGEASVAWGSEKISFTDLVSRLTYGQQVTLAAYRNGKKIVFDFKFQDAPLYPIRIMYPEYEKIDYEVLGGLVIMNLSENHILTLFSIMPELILYEKPENQVDPVLIVSYIFPGSEIYRLRAFNMGTIIREVNGIAVKTVDEFRSAVKTSLKSGYFTIKTDDVFVVLNIMSVLRDEIRLAQDYKYPLSPAVRELLVSIEAVQSSQAENQAADTNKN